MQGPSRGGFSEGKLSLVLSSHMEINDLIFCSFLVTAKLLQKQTTYFYGMKKASRERKLRADTGIKEKEYLGIMAAEGHSLVQVKENLCLKPNSVVKS